MALLNKSKAGATAEHIPVSVPCLGCRIASQDPLLGPERKSVHRFGSQPSRSQWKRFGKRSDIAPAARGFLWTQRVTCCPGSCGDQQGPSRCQRHRQPLQRNLQRLRRIRLLRRCAASPPLRGVWFPARLSPLKASNTVGI